MCGRYVAASPPDEIARYFDVAQVGEAVLEPSYNVAPTNDVYVVRGPRGELLLPATDDVVLEVDLPSGRLVVEVIEGLEWTAPKAPRRAMGQRKTPGSPRTRA